MVPDLCTPTHRKTETQLNLGRSRRYVCSFKFIGHDVNATDFVSFLFVGRNRWYGFEGQRRNMGIGSRRQRCNL